jgi:hypothetical protein
MDETQVDFRRLRTGSLRHREARFADAETSRSKTGIAYFSGAEAFADVRECRTPAPRRRGAFSRGALSRPSSVFRLPDRFPVRNRVVRDARAGRAVARSSPTRFRPPRP